MSNVREQWSSKASFILAAAGSAVGLGNIWKFPYIAGENGGAAFLFIYMICIVMIGLPILNIEILLGRATQKNPVGAQRHERVCSDDSGVALGFSVYVQ